MSPTFRAFRNRNYRLFYVGQLVSLVGTWMQLVAQGWLALELTDDSGSALGLVTGLQTFPTLVLGLWGGVLADRFDKRRVLLAAMSVQAVLALALAVLDLTGVITFTQLCVLAVLQGTVTALEVPTRQAFIPEMVVPDDLANAVALNSASFNAARVFGPVLAGFLVAAAGTGPAFVVNAMSFAAVIAALMAMRVSDLSPPPRVDRGPGQVRAGLRYVASRRQLLLPVVVAGIIGAIGFNFPVVLPLIAKETFGRDAAAYGVLSAASAVGAVAGALYGARRVRPPRLRVMLPMLVLFGVLEALAAFAPTFELMCLALLPVGFVLLLVTTASIATVQLAASPQMRGRAMSLYTGSFIGGTAIGAPLVGVVSQLFGPRTGLFVCGAGSALAAIVAGVLFLRRGGFAVHAQVRPRPRLVLVPPDEIMLGASGG